MSKKKKRRMTGAQRDRIKKRRREERRRLIMRASNIKKKKKVSSKKEKAKKDLTRGVQAAKKDTEAASSAAAAKRRGKKKVSYFYLFYFALVVLFLAALFFFLETVRTKLADYEASRPYNYINKIMDDCFKPGDAEKIIEASGYETGLFDRKEDVVSLVEDFLSQGTEYYSISTLNEGELKYAVRSGDLKFAEVTMAPNGEHDGAGYDVYGLTSMKLLIGGTYAVNISSPGDGKVFLNGIPIPDEYIVDRVEYENDPRVPDDIPNESRVTYEVTGMIGEPVVTAIDRYGNDVTDLMTVTDNVFYDVPYTYAVMTDDVYERAIGAGEAIAAFMQKDAGFWNAAQYIDPASDLYRDLQTSDVRWANEHNGYSIEDPSVTEFVMWSDSFYSVRVRFTHVLYRWGGNFENYFDTTFFYKAIDGKWLITASRVN